MHRIINNLCEVRPRINMRGLTSQSLKMLLILALCGCGRIGLKEREITPVRVMKVSPGDLKEELFYVGDILAQDQAEVYPKVTGKVAEYKVKEGDAVEKGATIVLIDRDEVGFQFEPAPVASPIVGIIGRVYLDRGAQVSPQVAVANVVNITNVKLRIDVSEIDLSKLVIGQKVFLSVDAYPDKDFIGTVDRISPVLDIWSRSAPVEVSIPNQEQLLKPGMFAKARIIVREKKGVLWINKDVIVNENYVFTVVKDKAKLCKIELGMKEDTKVEVISGLKEGDLVVVMGQVGLQDDEKVRVVE